MFNWTEQVAQTNCVIKVVSIFLPGLKGTIRISKLFNDTDKVKELMIWWSSKVGTKVSDLHPNGMNISSDAAGDAQPISPNNETIKGKLETYHGYVIMNYSS